MTFELGQFAEVTRTYTSADLADFQVHAGLDSSNEISSVPGPLIGALFSYLLGVELPGRGTNYLKQEMQFLEPASPGEALTARVTISRLRPEKHLVDLETVCTSDSGKIICEGRALVYVEDVGKG